MVCYLLCYGYEDDKGDVYEEKTTPSLIVKEELDMKQFLEPAREYAKWREARMDPVVLEDITRSAPNLFGKQNNINNKANNNG
ncbi:MAG: hypothetical protein SVE93_07155 [Candidatus Thermoplasmatota archaeon]|nr:hypothetical protein [Candidatus Thermoplasmatota archaeon]